MGATSRRGRRPTQIVGILTVLFCCVFAQLLTPRALRAQSVPQSHKGEAQSVPQSHKGEAQSVPQSHKGEAQSSQEQDPDAAHVAPHASLGRASRLERDVPLSPSIRAAGRDQVENEASSSEVGATADEADKAFASPFVAKTATGESSRTARVAPSDLAGDSDPGVEASPAKASNSKDNADESPNTIHWGHHIGLTVVWLVVICIVAWFVLRLFYSSGGMAGFGIARKRYIRIVDRQILSPQKSLMVVEVADRLLLLGVAEQQIQLLTELNPSKISEANAISSTESTSASATQAEVSPADKGQSETQQQLSALFGRRQPPEGPR